MCVCVCNSLSGSQIRTLAGLLIYSSAVVDLGGNRGKTYKRGDTPWRQRKEGEVGKNGDGKVDREKGWRVERKTGECERNG